MEAGLVYFLKVFQTAPTQVSTGVAIPISVHRSVSTTIGGSESGGHASASVCGPVADGPGCLSVDTDSGPLALADDVHLLIEFSKSELLAGTAQEEVDFDLETSCTLVTAAGTRAHCSKTADPVLGFDQAAFDASQGADTFALADHFGLQVSEGVAPEPRGDALCLGAIASLAVAAWTRRDVA
jgi:hypothetical protein